MGDAGRCRCGSSSHGHPLAHTPTLPNGDGSASKPHERAYAGTDADSQTHEHTTGHA